MYTLRDVCRRDSGESYTCARPTGQRGLRTPAFGADTVTGREEPVRHVVRGPFGFLGPRPARPAVNIHSFIPGGRSRGASKAVLRELYLNHQAKIQPYRCTVVSR